jgi:NAD-dependent SIR2 family protein deacetylase
MEGRRLACLPYYNMLKNNLEKAAQILKNAEALLISAGAGIGVDSGLPDFRGNEGFWKAYPLIAKLGKSFVEMANPQWFHRNPKIAWAFYGHRLNLYRKTVPHTGFTQLLNIARQKPGGYFVLTSNVDGQFQKAGYDDSRIEECHGSIHHFQCVQPCSDDIWDGSDIAVTVNEEVFEALEPLPRCRNCGGTARPNILMFGDWSWNAQRTDIQREKFLRWFQDLPTQGLSLAVIEIGAGNAVSTVRNFSEQVAKSNNATLIRINPRDYAVPHVRHISLSMGAAEALDALVTAMKEVS